MSKVQISALLTIEEDQILTNLAQKANISKSQMIGQAIINYKRIKTILENEQRQHNQEKTETQVKNYANSQD